MRKGLSAMFFRQLKVAVVDFSGRDRTRPRTFTSVRPCATPRCENPERPDFLCLAPITGATDSSRGVELYDLVAKLSIKPDDARCGLVRQHDRTVMFGQPLSRANLFVPAETIF